MSLFHRALAFSLAVRPPAAASRPSGRPPAVLTLGLTASLFLAPLGARLPWAAEKEKEHGSPALTAPNPAGVYAEPSRSTLRTQAGLEAKDTERELTRALQASQQAGIEGSSNLKISRRKWIRKVGLGLIGASLLAIPGDIPPPRAGTDFPDEILSRQVPYPSRSMDSYFADLHELSFDLTEETTFPWAASSDRRQSGAFLEIRNRGGTMIGVSSQFNFSLAVHAQPSTYVILDINPVVTEVLVPFFGYMMERAETRREFLSQLLGVELSEDHVKQLLEPKARTGIGLYDYLRNTLGEILSRFPIEQRRRWYEEHLRAALEREIFSRLHRLGRFRRFQRAEGFVEDEFGRTGFHVPKSRLPVETIRYFLHPDQLLKGSERRHLPNGDIDFVMFLGEHATASWAGHQYGGWLSTEENYRTARRYWMQGRFVGMTADLTDRDAINKLSRWLQQHRKEKISVIYSSDVSRWVEAEKAEQMYRQFSQLPLREGASQVCRLSFPRKRESILAVTLWYRHVWDAPPQRVQRTTKLVG